MFGRVDSKCPASLENMDDLGTLGPYSQRHPLAASLIWDLCALAHRGFYLVEFFLSASPSIHCTSWPVNTFEFENHVLTLTGDLLGDGGNLLAGPQSTGRTSCMHHPSNKQINDENLPLFLFRGKKEFKEESCLEIFMLIVLLTLGSVY